MSDNWNIRFSTCPQSFRFMKTRKAFIHHFVHFDVHVSAGKCKSETLSTILLNVSHLISFGSNSYDTYTTLKAYIHTNFWCKMKLQNRFPIDILNNLLDIKKRNVNKCNFFPLIRRMNALRSNVSIGTNVCNWTTLDPLR